MPWHSMHLHFGQDHATRLSNSKDSNSSMYGADDSQNHHAVNSPCTQKYVIQEELWNSRLHHVLEIKTYRPTTTQCLCHHHT